MAGRDPVHDMIRRARLSVANAERAVTLLEAEVSRKMVAPQPGARHDELQNILQQRIALRDKARRHLQDLLSRPRWQLEQSLAAQEDA